MSWEPVLTTVFDKLRLDTGTGGLFDSQDPIVQLVRSVRFSETVGGVDFAGMQQGDFLPILLIVPLTMPQEHTFAQDCFLATLDVEVYASMHNDDQGNVASEQLLSRASDRVREVLHRVTPAAVSDGQNVSWTFGPMLLSSITPIEVGPQETVTSAMTFEVYCTSTA